VSIRIVPLNESFVTLNCEEAIAKEARDYFTFQMPGYQFSPKFRAKQWDGKIRLIDRSNKVLRGLVPRIQSWAKEQNYDIEWEDPNIDLDADEVSSFLKNLNLPFELRDYQINTFLRAIQKKRALFLSPTSCHKKDDLIFTTKGWVKIQDIKIGDFVFGPDGSPKEVLRTFEGEDELYEIIPQNKRPKITVTGNHVLLIKHNDGNKKYGYARGDNENITKITVNDYLKKSNYYKHCSVLTYNEQPLLYGTNPNTSLSPYFIGCYLGDGHTHKCAITSIDKEIMDAVYQEATKFGCSVTSEKTKSINYKITHPRPRYNPILTEFRRFGLIFCGKNRNTCETKHVPIEFLNSPKEFRKELLAGLLDTDGHLNSSGTYFDFTVKSEQLANDAAQLAISLGLVAHTTPKFNKKYNRNYYRTIIMGNIESIPTRVPRKQANKIPRLRRPYISKFDVNSIGSDKYYGIEVKDHLYVTNGGMVTHNSGKGAIIYAIFRYLHAKRYSSRTLIIVPNTSLVVQLTSDFADYGYDCDRNVHQLYDGATKETQKPILISTWQAIQNMPRKWFEQFDCIIGDEAHGCKAKSLTYIISSCTNAKFRFGLTGTLDDTKVHQLILEGLFGATYKATTTSELMSRGEVTKFEIKALVLKYGASEARLVSKLQYHEEMEWLCGHEGRNEFISNLAVSQKTNTLVLFQYIEKHGDVLYDLIKKKAGKRKVFYVHGGSDTEERDAVRAIVEKEKDAIIIASVGVFSTGINIKNLHNVIFASPSKARIKTLQSIGRVLRLHKDKDIATLYDIADDLKYKNNANYTLKHFVERLKIYASEKFKFRVYNIEMKEPL
jgi:superfamily II DNA or RNA helicase